MTYDHPYKSDGVDSHRFHQENLVPVKAHMATNGETGLTVAESTALELRYKQGMSAVQTNLLTKMGVRVVPGLPLVDSQKFVAENGYFIGPSSGDGLDKKSVSYPDAGRDVTFREGYVLGNRVFVDHGEKGLGKTQSVTVDHIGYKAGPGSVVGIVGDVKYDFCGTNMAEGFEILVPAIMPPIAFDEVIVDGQKVSAEGYLPTDPLLGVGRLWSSNIRVSSLYPGRSSYLMVADFRWIENNTETAMKVFDSRVNGYLARSKVVNQYNAANGTNFDIGCGSLMGSDYSKENYSKAFRIRTFDNVSKMVANDFYHDNCSQQNVSVAAEIGDWDKHAFVDENGYWRQNDGHVFKNKEVVAAYRADSAFAVVFRTYQTQGLVDAAFGNDFITLEQYWDGVKNPLPEDHWAKNLSVEQLILETVKSSEREWTSSVANFSQKRNVVEVWTNEIKVLSEHIHNHRRNNI